jgi:hypothetical protein
MQPAGPGFGDVFKGASDISQPFLVIEITTEFLFVGMVIAN